ncbi:MAG TPA: hypothetical protein VGQ45_12795 [Gaiellales bacterium]|nr:hypothetical protein [Gaiellales bacterium]
MRLQTAAALLLVTAGCTSAGVAQPASSGQSGRSTTLPAVHHRHAHHRHHHHAHPAATGRRDRVPAVDVPRRSLTPGAAFAVGTARICVSGYSASVRNVPQAEATAVYDRYGVAHVPYAHEVDHLVSLEIGGSNAIANLWPEPYAGRWGARTKDLLENRLHELVCSGLLALRKAQRIEARDWVSAYRRYVGGTPTAATNRPSAPAGGSSAGGYYASSFGTASTIYCADDDAWRELSTRYLRHFRTWAGAHRRFPSYHLHRPC